MTKQVAVLFLLLGILISFDSRSQILVGPVAGGGVSWLSFHEKESRQFYKQSPVPTFLGGIGVSFEVRKNFYMHTALMYSRKGANLSSTVDPTLKQKETYHFIEAPIIFAREFKINLGHNRIVKWYAGMGPNISYWLNGKGSMINDQLLEDGFGPIVYKFAFKSTDNPDPSKVYLPDANRLQLGLNVATGWVFEPVGLSKIYVNIRYEIGNTYISKSGVENFTGINDYTGDLKARNMGLRFSVSYLVDLKPAEKKKGQSVNSSGKRIKKKRK